MKYSLFCLKYLLALCSLLAVFFGFSFDAYAQLETISNGGIVDGNTQKDDDDDDVDLDKSKYKPGSMSSRTRSDGAIALSWNDEAKGEDGYQVYRKRGGGSWQSLAVLDKNIESYIDRSTKPDQTYQYRVRAYNSSSETDYSSVVTVRTAPQDPNELLSNDVVQKEISDAVSREKEKSEQSILNLEEELRKANSDLKKSNEKLEQTEACSIDVIPDAEIEREVEARCQTYPGKQQIEKATEKTTSLLSQLFASTTARIVMSGLLLFGVLNNVWWHMTHRSVRREMHHHREQHAYHKEQHEHHREQHERLREERGE